MVKKAGGKKNHPAEILDDNGTLIAAAADVAGANPRGADEGESPAHKRDIPKP
jgi:hypothetical protein